MNDQKPREWVLIRKSDGTLGAFECASSMLGAPEFHVIEYSAFEEEKKCHEILVDVHIKRVEQLKKENAELRKEVEEVRAAGKVMVEASDRHFNTATENYNECVELRKEVEKLKLNEQSITKHRSALIDERDEVKLHNMRLEQEVERLKSEVTQLDKALWNTVSGKATLLSVKDNVSVQTNEELEREVRRLMISNDKLSLLAVSCRTLLTEAVERFTNVHEMSCALDDSADDCTCGANEWLDKAREALAGGEEK